MANQHISEYKQKQLKERMKKIGILEKDIKEKFILGSGRGGQKINKTESGVYLRHEPTEIFIKCQQTRSRELNRYKARQRLCDQAENKLLGKESPEEKKRQKIKKQKARRRRRSDIKD